MVKVVIEEKVTEESQLFDNAEICKRKMTQGKKLDLVEWLTESKTDNS